MDAILTAIITAALGLATWSGQQMWSRRASERHRREALYQSLLDALVDMSSIGDSGPLVVESQRMWFYSSDEVLRAVNDYLQYYLEGVEPGREVSAERRRGTQAHEAVVRLAIRRDLQPSTSISKTWVDREWQPVAAPPKSIQAYRERQGKGRLSV